MKKICLLLIMAGLTTALEAKEKKEPVVMIVAGKEVPLSEFIYMVKKDNSVNLKNKQSVKNYVELYKNYKLKVADAESLSINEAPRFETEMERLGNELQQSYLVDKSGEDAVLRTMYERAQKIPVIKEIYFSYPHELYEKGNIMVRKGQVLTQDTFALFEKANAAYNRIKNGESFEAVGESFANDSTVLFFRLQYVLPFRLRYKPIEDYVYSMEVGDISQPVRDNDGFHILKIDRILPEMGTVRAMHILTAFPSENPTADEIEETRRKSEEIYQKTLTNEDFNALAIAFSSDSVNAKNGSILEFGIGGVLEPMEKAGFALEKTGDISEPFQTKYGFHILKLVERKPPTPFEEVESKIHDSMQASDRLFDLYRSFHDKMKERHKYVFYPEAWQELEQLADENFPIDSAFVERSMEMEKTLIKIDSLDFPQNLFVQYMISKYRTLQIYSVDFMKDVFRFFEREILLEVERRSLERDYPDFLLQMNEYYDGTLLFEISNKRVWSKPVELQEQFEAEWVKELNEKYPVTINWKVINKIKKK